MILFLQSFTSLVRQQARAIQAAASVTVDVAIGTGVRAVIEATAGVGMWLQYVALQVLRTTRAATSVGADLDTWMADYGLTRLPAVTATGFVTMSRYTATTAAFVPAGVVCKSSDGSLTYVVTADTSNPAYSAALSGYNVPISVTSIDLPVTCSTPGAGGNVLAGVISLLGSAVPGIDYIANAAALTNGQDAESDTSFRGRFPGYIASLARATGPAISFAVSSVQAGLSSSVLENILPDGSTDDGAITVVVDDGTGAPTADLLSRVYASCDQYRPLCSKLAVIGPILIPVSVQMTIQTANSTVKPSVIAAVQAALASYLNALPVGSPISYLRLAQITYDADSRAVNISSYTLNGSTADLPANPTTVYRVGSIVLD